MHAWKMFFDGLFRGKSYEERMNEFLGQATSREHLEYLENVWFKNNRKY